MTLEVEDSWERSMALIADFVLSDPESSHAALIASQPKRVHALRDPPAPPGCSLASVALLRGLLDKALARTFEQDAEISRLRAELEASRSQVADLKRLLQKANLNQLEHAIAEAIVRGLRLAEPTGVHPQKIQPEAAAAAVVGCAAWEPRHGGEQGAAIGIGRLADGAAAPHAATVAAGNDADALTCNVPQLVRLAARGDEAQTLALLDCGEDPNIRDDMGITALHGAAKKGHSGIVALLLDRRADANARSQAPRGETPMHYACKYGHDGVVLTLLRHGASPLTASGAGKTPLDYAKGKNSLLIQGILKGYMAANGPASLSDA